MSLTQLTGLLVGQAIYDQMPTKTHAFAHAVAAVDAAAVQKAMAPCAGHEVISVIGPLKGIESAGLEKTALPCQRIWR